jgi:hypothetical protein
MKGPNFSPKEIFFSILYGRSLFKKMAHLLSMWQNNGDQAQSKLTTSEFLKAIAANICRFN